MVALPSPDGGQNEAQSQPTGPTPQAERTVADSSSAPDPPRAGFWKPLRRWFATHEWVTATFVILLAGAVIAAIQARIAYRQMEISERQTVIMGNQTAIQEKQTAIAKQQADIAMLEHLPVFVFEELKDEKTKEASSPTCMIARNTGKPVRDLITRSELMIRCKTPAGEYKWISAPGHDYYIHGGRPGGTGLLYYYDQADVFRNLVNKHFISTYYSRGPDTFRPKLYIEIEYVTLLGDARIERYMVSYPYGYEVKPLQQKPVTVDVVDLDPFWKDNKLDVERATAEIHRHADAIIVGK